MAACQDPVSLVPAGIEDTTQTQTQALYLGEPDQVVSPTLRVGLQRGLEWTLLS